MTLALSLQSDIKSIGAYCGFAALVGLALLALLYFAQAREMRRMSEWIEREEERRRFVPAPVARQPVAVPVVAVPPAATPGAVTTAVPGVRRVAVPATPAAAPATGVIPAATPAAAPATGVIGAATPAATVVVPPPSAETDAADPPEADVAASVGAGIPESVAEAAPAAEPGAEEEHADEAPADLPPAPAIALASAPPPTAEPRRVQWPRPEEEAAPPAEVEAEAASPEPRVPDPPPLAPSTVAGSRPRFPPPPSPAGGSAPASSPAEMLRATPADSLTTIRRPEPTRRREREVEDTADERGGGPSRVPWSTIRLVLAAVVIVAVLIFIVQSAFGGGGGKHHDTPPAGSTQTNGGPAPGSVTVAVLNGTGTPHLASGAAGVLAGLGFREGAVADASSQGHKATIVYYVAPSDRTAAIEVARDLRVNTIHVHHAHASTVAAASVTGGVPQVIVLLGSNYAAR
jgi:hypothetical protein